MSDRLPSFKGPRDLSLLSPTTPTLPPSPLPPRSKRVFKPNIPPKRDKSAIDTSEQPHPHPSPSTPSSSTKTTPTPSRSSGRGRGRTSNLIQSASVFAEGVGDPVTTRKSTRPTCRPTPVQRLTPTVTKETLSQIIKPIKEQRRTVDIDLIESEDTKELMDLAVVLPLGENSKPPPTATKTKTRKQKKLPPLPLKQLSLFQLPSHLPMLTDQDQKQLSNNIESLPEGRIGKIQILSNGKYRFVLENENKNYFSVESGLKTNFRQDLVLVGVDSGRLVELGQVGGKVVVTPDIGGLFI